jgi:hypothetical protein
MRTTARSIRSTGTQGRLTPFDACVVDAATLVHVRGDPGRR